MPSRSITYIACSRPHRLEPAQCPFCSPSAPHTMKRAFSLQDTAPLVDLTADLWAARRRQAVIWAVIVAGLVTFYSSITAYVVPKPPSKMGMYWPAKEDSGLSIAELAQLMGAATAMGVAITAVQDLAWPFMSKHRKGEKVRGQRNAKRRD